MFGTGWSESRRPTFTHDSGDSCIRQSRLNTADVFAETNNSSKKKRCMCSCSNSNISLSKRKFDIRRVLILCVSTSAKLNMPVNGQSQRILPYERNVPENDRKCS